MLVKKFHSTDKHLIYSVYALFYQWTSPRSKNKEVIAYR